MHTTMKRLPPALLTLIAGSLFLPAVVWTYAIAGTVEFQAGGVLAGLVDSSSAGALLFLFAVGASMCVLPPLSA